MLLPNVQYVPVLNLRSILLVNLRIQDTRTRQGACVMNHVAIRVLVAALLVVTASPVLADDTKPQDAHWPQFRGPQGGGIASGARKLPVHFGPQQKVLWKTPLPQGASSP